MNVAAPGVSYFFGSRTQNAGDERRHAVPLLTLRVELASARRGQPVELRLAFVVRFTPLAGDPALVLQPVERRVQRSLLDLKLSPEIC